jgi:hypothetical protein
MGAGVAWMGRPSKPKPREHLEKQIRSLAAKLAHVHDDRDSTAHSLQHASDQVSYWRCCQALAIEDLWAEDKGQPDWDRRKMAKLDARQCSDQAAEWEKRKGEILKVRAEQEKVEKLAEIAAKLDEQMASAGALNGIRT